MQPRTAARNPTHVLDRLSDLSGTLRPGTASASFRTFLSLWRPIIRAVLRPRVEGWEHLPDGPYLLVANHSGGGVAELVAIAERWLVCQPKRRLATMAHPVAFHVPGAAAFVRNGGAIPSTRRHALEALDSGTPVMVFPGGDHEAFRPLWQHKQVDFAGRRGFLRLARTAWVPIVPLGISGSHITVPILWRSRVLPWVGIVPRLAGLKRLPVSLPLVLALVLTYAAASTVMSPPAAAALAWVWLAFPVPALVPMVPTSIRFRFGAPITPESLFGERQPPAGEADEATLAAARDRVQATVQALVA